MIFMADRQDPSSTGQPGWSLQRLPAMDEAQFSQWQALLEHRTGMTLTHERKSFLEANLSIRMREIGCGSYQTYYEKVVEGYW